MEVSSSGSICQLATSYLFAIFLAAERRAVVDNGIIFKKTHHFVSCLIRGKSLLTEMTLEIRPHVTSAHEVPPHNLSWEGGKKRKKKEQIDERINEALAGLSFIARDDRAAHQTQEIPQEHAGKL